VSLTAGVKRLTGRGPDLPARLAALREAVEATEGRLDPELLTRAGSVLERAEGRLALAGDHTVVALAGATGSGKSSLFNALAGSSLSQVGVRRPTTSSTTAAAWGEADEVLAWLQVPQRHQVGDQSSDPGRLGGLVLLDLPDHDSTEVAHHLEVDRLVEVVDLLVFVLDPQKYADAAIHHRYLAPLQTHREVMLVVLNHVDEVAPDRRRDLDRDLARLLDADGLTGVPRLQTSAVTGEGVDALRDVLAERVAATRAAAARLSADVAAVAGAMREASGEATSGGRKAEAATGAQRAELVSALAESAGVPTVVRAVERSMVRRGSLRTGWPVLAWRARLRPDPLRRLHLDRLPGRSGDGDEGREPVGPDRTSLPAPSRVERARAETAVRRVADAVGEPLTPAWQRAVRRASLSRTDDLEDALDRAVASVDLGVDKVPLWWRLARLLQLVLVTATLAGAIWLGLLALVDFVALPIPDPPETEGIPVPTLLLVVGLAGGWALAVLSRVVNGWVARSRGRKARRRLELAVAEVADRFVLQPVAAEISAYDRARSALQVAAATPRR
jgi:GTP-binding protein EngB required for normal cell division